MACEYLLVSVDGEIILSINDYDTNNFNLDTYLSSVNPSDLGEIKTELLKAENKNIADSVDISRLNQLISTNDYDIEGVLDVAELVKNADSANQEMVQGIQEKINYLSQNHNKPLKVLVVKTDNLQHGSSNIEGLKIENSNSLTIIVQDSGNVSDFLMNINHELNHHIYDDALTNNYSDLSSSMLSIYDAVKPFSPKSPKTETERKIKKIFDKLPVYQKRGIQAHEFFNWMFGDQDMFNFINRVIPDKHRDKLNTIIETLDISPMGRKRTVQQELVSRFEYWLKDNQEIFNESRVNKSTAIDKILGMTNQRANKISKNFESFLSKKVNEFASASEDGSIDESTDEDSLVQEDDYDDLEYVDDVPLSITDNVLDKNVSIIDKYNLKYNKKEDYKERNKRWYDALEDVKTKMEKDGTMSIQYEEAKPVTDKTQIYKLDTGSIIQVPYFLSRSLKNWQEILSPEQLIKLIPNYESLAKGEYHDGTKRKTDKEIWVEISYPKMFKFLTDLGTSAVNSNAELKKLFDTVTSTKNGRGKNPKPMHQRVMNKMIAYIKRDDGMVKVAAPKLLKSKPDANGNVKEYKTIAYYDINDIVGTRKLIGIAKKTPKIPAKFLEPLKQYQRELGKTVEYVKPENGEFDWNPSDVDYINPVLFKGISKNNKAYEFTSEVTQSGNLRIKGFFGKLNKIAKQMETGTFVRFSLGFDDAKKAHEMVYGRILGNGASGAVVVYQNGRSAKKVVVSHSMMTEIFFPVDSNSEVQAILNDANVVNAVDKDTFGAYMAALYSTDNKNTLINNVAQTEQYLKKKNPGITPEDLKKIKYYSIKKAKPGSVVRYTQRMDNGKIVNALGTFFAIDDEFTYVIPKYGNELLKIPHENQAGEFNKDLNVITDSVFVKSISKQGREYYKNPYAIDTVFIDQTTENHYVEHLEKIRDLLKSSTYLSKQEPGYVPKTIDDVKREFPGISTQEAMIRLNQLNKKTSTTYNDIVDVIQFNDFKVEQRNNRKYIMDQDKTQLLDEHDQYKIFSKLRLGDMILYFNEYDEKDDSNNKTGNKMVYERWQIITGFDEDSGLPIISYRTGSGRIKSQVVKLDYVKSVGLQLQTVTGDDNFIIEGRPEIVKRREENRKKFVNSKEITFTQKEADELIEKKNRPLKSDSRLRYEKVALPYVKGKKGYYFTLKNVKGIAVPPGVEQQYKIIKKFKDENGTWNNSTIAERKFMLEMYAISHANSYNFDTYAKGVRNGSILRISKEYPNKGRKYYDLYVEGSTKNEIRGQVMWSSDAEGEDFKSFPMSLTRNDIVPTFIHSAYNVNYKIFTTDKQVLKPGTSISQVISKLPENQVKKSESDIFGVKKTQDSLKEIKSAVTNLVAQYNADVEFLDENSIKDLGKKLELDLSKARGLVFDNKIYINGDTASVAEAFHELGHIIMPGLKSLNPQAWEVIKDKVKTHPVYESIVNQYGHKLSENDLAEEAFVTIFGEYYREKYLKIDSKTWFDETPEFNEITHNTNDVIGNIFDLDTINDVDTTKLMNMSLLQVMNQFGERVVSGGMKVYFDEGIIINNNTLMQSIYSRLIDKGSITKNC